MSPARLLLLASFALPVLWIDNLVTSLTWLSFAVSAVVLHERDPQWTEDAQEATR